jgi:hypothetical protein
MVRGPAWTVGETRQLKRLMRQAGEPPEDGKVAYWEGIAAKLDPVDENPPRSGRAAENQATRLKEREALDRGRRAPGWDALKRRQTTGDSKNAPRKRKRDEAATDSPVHDEPSGSPGKRAAADVARNRIQMQIASPGESPVKRPPVLHESAKRQAIAAQFVYEHKQPTVDKWFGKDGTIKKILTEITWLPGGSWGTMLDVLTEVTLAAESGIQYSGLRAVQDRAQALIKLDTEAGRTQAQILADEIEDGGSYQNATDMVNEWRKTQPSVHCLGAVPGGRWSSTTVQTTS